MAQNPKNSACLKLVWLVPLFLWGAFSAQMCTKSIVYGRDYATTPQKGLFSTDTATVKKAVERVLQKEGFEIVNADESRGRFLTGWRSVEADSHFVNLFGRKDFGVSDGCYYRLIVDITEDGPNVKVILSTTVKSIVGPLESTGKVEKRILAQLTDILRSPQIEMTNVGTDKKQY